MATRTTRKENNGSEFDVSLKVALLGADGVGKATILKSFAEETAVDGKLQVTYLS